MKDYLNECEVLSSELNIDEGIKKLNNTVETIKREMLKPDRVKRKSWMKEGILQLMEKRRGLINNSPEKYRKINKVIKKEIRETKEEEMKEK